MKIGDTLTIDSVDYKVKSFGESKVILENEGDTYVADIDDVDGLQEYGTERIGTERRRHISMRPKVKGRSFDKISDKTGRSGTIKKTTVKAIKRHRSNLSSIAARQRDDIGRRPR